MRVLIAPDKFKGSLTAAQAAEVIAAGLRRARPDAELVTLPVADGGDGTLAAVVAAGARPVEVRVTGPTGQPVTATFALTGSTGRRLRGSDAEGGRSIGGALVEMAEASGLRRLPGGVPAPLDATTYGTGELIRAALDHGAGRITLGIGGSATTDGGAGMAAALGVRFLDADGKDLPPGGAALLKLASVDTAGLDPRLAGVEVEVACDVDNPLTGPNGAASVYGPQKGAAPGDVLLLDSALRRYARVLAETPLGQARGARPATDGAAVTDVGDVPGAGAAGGLGFGALVFLGASLRPGIDLILEVVGFEQAIQGADLVITGEGALDAQSLRGKAPHGVARAAGAHGIPVVALAGMVDLPPLKLRAAGFEEAHALTDLEPDVQRCHAEAAQLLERLAEQVGRAWASLP